MRKIILSMWITLDGFIAGPNDEMEWVTEIYDEAMGKYESDLVNSADTLLLGRGTYQSFAGYWPHVLNNPDAPKDEVEYAQRANIMQKVVFSKTLERAEWNNSTLVREIIPAEIEHMKQQPGNDIVIYGSARIVRALTNLGLIDEYQLLVHPTILGNGKPFFQDSKHNLKLITTRTHPSGVVALFYQPIKE